MPAKPKTVIEPGKCYHIFNRGNNRRLIFDGTQSFERFLLLVQKYLLSVAKVQAYALLPDHFHLQVTFKEAKNLPALFLEKPAALGRSIGHLQNAYAKYWQSRHPREVSGLFERSYERIPVESEVYFRQLVLYLHKNPVKHGQSVRFHHYPWTSYAQLTAPDLRSFLDKESVWQKFGGREAFLRAHEKMDAHLWDQLTLE